VPVTAPRLDRAAAEEHTAVALEEALHRRRGVRVVVRAAGGAREVAVLASLEVVPAARAEAPAVENARHRADDTGQARRRSARTAVTPTIAAATASAADTVTGWRFTHER